MREVGQALVRRRPYLEGAVTGLAFSGALVALSAFAVGSFRPGDLAFPYWGRIGWLRTDTFGLACLIMALLTFTCSEFLRLSRITRHGSSTPQTEPGPLALFTLAAARATAAASATVVVYLSVNAVTHPETLEMPATHLLSWPTESTVRAAALVVTACAVAVTRTQRIALNRAGRV
jgi:hypothetical protein